MTLLLVCNGEEVVVPNAITLTDAIVLLRHQLQDQIMHSQYSHFTMYCSVCLYLWVLRLNYASSSVYYCTCQLKLTLHYVTHVGNVKHAAINIVTTTATKDTDNNY